MFSEDTVVLSCGATQAALARFTGRDGAVRLEAMAVRDFSLEMPDEPRWLEQIGDALPIVRDKLKLAGPAVLVLPAHLVLLKHIKTPRAEAAQREKVIRFAAGQAIPAMLTDVAWDSVVAAEHGPGLEVLLGAAKLEVVESLCAVVRSAGFEPRLALPSPLATLAAFRLAPAAPPEPVLVLNPGPRSTVLLQVEKSGFAARTLILGTQYNRWQMPDKNDPVARQVLVTRLAQEITRSVLHFRVQCGMENPTRIRLAGGDDETTALGKALAAKLEMPVDRFDVPGVIAIADGARDAAARNPLALVDLAGAASTQLLPGQPVLNLLSPQLRHDETRRRRQPRLAAAAVLAVAALLPPLGHLRAVTAAAREKTNALERQLEPWRERDARNRANLQRLEEFKQEIARLQGIHERRTSWLSLLADLQDRLVSVEDVWLERMSVASPPGTPLKLAVSGRMLDKTDPAAKAGPATFSRVKALLTGIADSPFVAGVEARRFHNERPGILDFDFVLVTNPARPL